jgi:hypothetical protein
MTLDRRLRCSLRLSPSDVRRSPPVSRWSARPIATTTPLSRRASRSVMRSEPRSPCPVTEGPRRDDDKESPAHTGPSPGSRDLGGWPPQCSRGQTSVSLSASINRVSTAASTSANYPQPAVVSAQPVVIAPAPVAVYRQPIYLYVPVVYQQNWGRYCGRYSACGQPVYFVQEQWVRERYRQEHESERGERRARHHDDDDDDHDHGHHRKNGHGHRGDDND